MHTWSTAETAFPKHSSCLEILPWKKTRNSSNLLFWPSMTHAIYMATPCIEQCLLLQELQSRIAAANQHTKYLRLPTVVLMVHASNSIAVLRVLLHRCRSRLLSCICSAGSSRCSECSRSLVRYSRLWSCPLEGQHRQQQQQHIALMSTLVLATVANQQSHLLCSCISRMCCCRTWQTCSVIHHLP